MADEAGSGFKVVDRRPFAEDGTLRQGASRAEEKTTVAAEKPRGKADQARSALDERVDEGFVMLVEFLANSAFIQLGLGGGPDGEPVPADLESARTMIDLLGVLQDKTKGNLSAGEQKFIRDILFELHTRFVEVQKRATGKRR